VLLFSEFSVPLESQGQKAKLFCMLHVTHAISGISKAQMHVKELPLCADEVLNADRA